MIEMMSQGISNAPGTRSINGCVFQSSIGGIAFERIAKVDKQLAVKAMAIDAVTAENEIRGDIIGTYHLKVQIADYRDKITGEMVTENTLVSPVFNNEPVAVWTDAGEYGNGTKEDYQRIVSRARALANSDSNSSMFWVSPGNYESGEETPHRAYLWVKKGDDVTAFSYSLTGNKENLMKFIDNMGYEGNDSDISLSDRTILKDVKFTHEDIFKAFTASFSNDELDKTNSFMNHFKQEIKIPEIVRDKHLEEKQQIIEKQIRNEYKNDIKQALQSIAVGMLGLANIKNSINRRDQKAVLHNSTENFPDAKFVTESGEQKDLLKGMEALIPAYIGIIDRISTDLNFYPQKEVQIKQSAGTESYDQIPSTLKEVDPGSATNKESQSPAQTYVIHGESRNHVNSEENGISHLQLTSEEFQAIFTNTFYDLYDFDEIHDIGKGIELQMTRSQNYPESLSENMNLGKILNHLNTFKESENSSPSEFSETELIFIDRYTDLVIRFMASAFEKYQGEDSRKNREIPQKKAMKMMEIVRMFMATNTENINFFGSCNDIHTSADTITILKLKLFMNLYDKYEDGKNTQNFILLLIIREIISLKVNPVLSEISSQNLLTDLFKDVQVKVLTDQIDIIYTGIRSLKDIIQLQTLKSIFKAIFILDRDIKDLGKSIRVLKLLLKARNKYNKYRIISCPKSMKNSIELILPYRKYIGTTNSQKTKSKKMVFPKSALIYLGL